MARTLDGCGKSPLMLCTPTGNPSRKDLAPLGNKSFKFVYILIIDARTRLVSAEYANFFPSAGYPSLHGSVALVSALFLIEWHIYFLLIQSSNTN